MNITSAKKIASGILFSVLSVSLYAQEAHIAFAAEHMPQTKAVYDEIQKTFDTDLEVFQNLRERQHSTDAPIYLVDKPFLRESMFGRCDEALLLITEKLTYSHNKLKYLDRVFKDFFEKKSGNLLSDADISAKDTSLSEKNRKWFEERKSFALFKKNVADNPYLVIDLLSGEVSFLEKVPEGGWTSEYKTYLQVFRRIEMNAGIIYCPIFETTIFQDILVDGSLTSKPERYQRAMRREIGAGDIEEFYRSKYWKGSNLRFAWEQYEQYKKDHFCQEPDGQYPAIGLYPVIANFYGEEISSTSMSERSAACEKAAQLYCEKLAEKLKQEGLEAPHIPHEVEWNMVALKGNEPHELKFAKSGGWFSSGGEEKVDFQIKYPENADLKHLFPVGSNSETNKLGIYDFLNNAQELVQKGQWCGLSGQGPAAGFRPYLGTAVIELADDWVAEWKKPKYGEAHKKAEEMLTAAATKVVVEREVEKEKAFLAKVEAGDAKRVDLGDGISLDFIKVPAGTFVEPSSFNNKKIIKHEVSEFFIGRFEVSQRQFEALGLENPSKVRAEYHPVENITFQQANAFVTKLAEKCKVEGMAFSLPSIDQYEWAALGGNQQDPGANGYSGGEDIEAVAWYERNSGKTTHKVGTKLPNGLGIYDLSGNVREWAVADSASSSGGSASSIGGAISSAAGGVLSSAGGAISSLFGKKKESSSDAASSSDATSSSGAGRNSDTDVGSVYNGGFSDGGHDCCIFSSRQRVSGNGWNLGFRVALIEDPALVAVREKAAADAVDEKLINEGLLKRIKLADGVNLDLIKVPSGSFKSVTGSGAGTRSAERNKEMTHEVEEFFIARTEVTRSQYRSVTGNLNTDTQGENSEYSDDVPFTGLGPSNAEKFCEELNKLHQIPGFVFSLPDEWQWEWAARGATKGKGAKFAGGDYAKDFAWCDEHLASLSLHPVAQKKPNELGLFDMSGNAAEMCHGNGNLGYICCGGAFRSREEDCAVSKRDNLISDLNSGHENLGFRVALVVDPTVAAEQAAKAYNEEFESKLKSGDAKRISLPKGATLDLIKVEAGKIVDPSDDEVVHSFDEFYLGRFEVTQKQYMSLCDENPSEFHEAEERPVESLKWYEALEFCRILNKECPVEGYEFILPDEWQWEWAASGASKSKGTKYAGSDEIDKVAWYDKGAAGDQSKKKKTHVVGQKMPNELGFFDMTGNVSEWCLNIDEERNGAEMRRYNAGKPEKGGQRVIRGGSYTDKPDQIPNQHLSVRSRDNMNAGSYKSNQGFRIALVKFNGKSAIPDVHDPEVERRKSRENGPVPGPGAAHEAEKEKAFATQKEVVIDSIFGVTFGKPVEGKTEQGFVGQGKEFDDLSPEVKEMLAKHNAGREAKYVTLPQPFRTCGDKVVVRTAGAGNVAVAVKLQNTIPSISREEVEAEASQTVAILEKKYGCKLAFEDPYAKIGGGGNANFQRKYLIKNDNVELTYAIEGTASRFTFTLEVTNKKAQREALSSSADSGADLL